MILLPEFGFILNILIKICAAVTIVAAAFGNHGIRRLIANTITFFAANFILAGVFFGVYSWFKPSFMHFCNSCFYIDFSLVVLIFTTCGMYFAVCMVRRFNDCTPDDYGIYRIIIRYGKNTASIDGLADTGNVLVDYFTGCPVIVCSETKFADITGNIHNTQVLPSGFRLLPCETVSENGLIPVFRPDEVIIENTAKGFRKSVDVLIGFGKNSGDAVFNPKLLKN